MRIREKSTRIYFVRHGETDYPTDRIYCDDREDPALNASGQVQAHTAAEYFRGMEIDAVYASPAQRTMMTALEVSRVVGKDILPLEQLRERRFGIWEGLYFAEIKEKYPEQHNEWKSNLSEYTPQGGESLEDMEHRLQDVIEMIRSKHAEKVVVVVTHTGAIRSLVTTAFNIPKDQFRQIKIDYASITTIDYGESKNNLTNLNIVRYT